MHRIISSLLLAGSTFASAAPDVTELEQDARELAVQFVSQLKPRLQQAMQEGGPTRAIEVCASAAPKIADSLSAESGWQIKRVSLKSRNASRAVPDNWESAVLQEFDRRQAAGEAAAQINYGEMQGTRYRYMQAQGTAGLCLTCHGEQLTPAVTETLQQYYPDDQAIGYQLGQVRGAISLSRQL
jgi:hypothetical protein